MASTYSNLKIQLMATGENNSTWGTVTNTNLGTAIEEAITGSADVTFASGDVTLTLTNTNSTQTARNLRLNLTGTTGGARNLIVPAIEKVYIVNNGCADTVTVKNSTGSGIAVPTGKTMYVYNTGSNVVDAITHLSSLTLASALPIASGGTGSTTATFSGANISSLNGSNVTSGTIDNARTTASSSNGASTIVARDSSGNFSANTITADITGNVSGNVTGNVSGNVTGNLTGTASNATVLQTARTIAIQDGVTGTATSFNGSANISIPVTAINASVINTGTIANARTTASSSNGASTIVARDASGNFSSNIITANTFSGSLSGNATNVSGTVAVANGGTGATSAGIARDNLDVPSRNGTGAAGTWGINISGFASSLSALRSFSLNSGATSLPSSFDGTQNVSLTVTDLNADYLGSGTIPRSRFPSGTVINTEMATQSTPATFNGGTYTIIPIDDTAPQNTEGAQVLSYNYACTLSSSLLIIDVVVNMSSAASSRILTAALFSSVSSSAIGATAVWEANNNYMQTLVFSARLGPGTTASRTYTVRISSNGGDTIYFNSNNGTSLFLGRLVSSIKFTEVRF